MEPTESVRSASAEAGIKCAGRLHQLRTELAIRMQPLCRDLPEALFEQLIDQMTLTRLRDEELNR